MKITLSIVRKEDDLKDFKNVFVSTFAENYKHLKPSQLKDRVKGPNDIQVCLKAIFEEEAEHFKKSTPENPVFVLYAKTEDKNL